ncbi:molybdate ABC transporter ATP-binding protein ModF [Paludibacter sp.]
MKHIGIYCTNSISKKKLINAICNENLLQKHIDLSNQHGEIYSSITIDKMIEEEYKHDKITIKTKANKTLESMSSGQQRRALAQYICEQDPDFIILDDLQSNVDIQTLESLYALFESHNSKCKYIQIFSRREDRLPYLDMIVEVDNNLKITNTFDIDSFSEIEEDVDTYNNISFPKVFSNIAEFHPLIELRNLNVSYESKQILNNINWKINNGEFWELRGPIGSGKSTLLSMIIGDNPKAFGQDIILFGRKKGSGESVWEIKEKIGYFYPKMTQLFKRNDSVEDMIISGFFDSIGLYVKPTGWQMEIAKEWMSILGKEYKGKRFQDLTMGQQRIILVVRALVKQPPLLILDEPTVGLDDNNANLFVSLIQNIAQTKKIAVIFVSHRKEKGLVPEHIFELKPNEYGSIDLAIK